MAEAPGSMRYRRAAARFTDSGSRSGSLGETEGENLPEMAHIHKARAKRYIRYTAARLQR
jgi:hypothetical protein